MHIAGTFLKTLVGTALALLATAGLADEHPVSKRAVNLPPSVDFQV